MAPLIVDTLIYHIFYTHPIDRAIMRAAGGHKQCIRLSSVALLEEGRMKVAQLQPADEFLFGKRLPPCNGCQNFCLKVRDLCLRSEKQARLHD